MEKLRIIFMGTPEFAVPSLQILVESGYDIIGVITAPDKPKGRGRKLSASAVKEYALSQSLNILQPTNLKSPEFIDQLKALNPNLQIVVAFRMLPEIVWNYPQYGTFNLHGSLLPQYRGAAPINWAIINGEKETGVTTFFLKHEIDTGSIILQEKESITDDDTVGSLYDRLMHIGGKLVLKTVDLIASGKVEGTPQDTTAELKDAPKIFKESCEINWDASSNNINNFVRGLNPYPAAWTTIGDKTAKVYKVVKKNNEKQASTGVYATDNKTYLDVTCQDGVLSITELQIQGKKKMQIEDFFRGNKLSIL